MTPKEKSVLKGIKDSQGLQKAYEYLMSSLQSKLDDKYGKGTYSVSESSGFRGLQKQQDLLKQGKTTTPISMHNFIGARDINIRDAKGNLTDQNFHMDELWPVAEELGFHHLKRDGYGAKDPYHIGIVEERGDGTAFNRLFEQHPWIKDTAEFQQIKDEYQKSKGTRDFRNWRNTKILDEILKPFFQDDVVANPITKPVVEKTANTVVENPVVIEKSPSAVDYFQTKPKTQITSNTNTSVQNNRPMATFQEIIEQKTGKTFNEIANNPSALNDLFKEQGYTRGQRKKLLKGVKRMAKSGNQYEFTDTGQFTVQSGGDNVRGSGKNKGQANDFLGAFGLGRNVSLLAGALQRATPDKSLPQMTAITPKEVSPITAKDSLDMGGVNTSNTRPLPATIPRVALSTDKPSGSGGSGSDSPTKENTKPSGDAMLQAMGVNPTDDIWLDKPFWTEEQANDFRNKPYYSRSLLTRMFGDVSKDDVGEFLLGDMYYIGRQDENPKNKLLIRDGETLNEYGNRIQQYKKSGEYDELVKLNQQPGYIGGTPFSGKGLFGEPIGGPSVANAAVRTGVKGWQATKRGADWLLNGPIGKPKIGFLDVVHGKGTLPKTVKEAAERLNEEIIKGSISGKLSRSQISKMQKGFMDEHAEIIAKSFNNPKSSPVIQKAVSKESAKSAQKLLGQGAIRLPQGKSPIVKKVKSLTGKNTSKKKVGDKLFDDKPLFKGTKPLNSKVKEQLFKDNPLFKGTKPMNSKIKGELFKGFKSKF